MSLPSNGYLSLPEGTTARACADNCSRSRNGMDSGQPRAEAFCSSVPHGKGVAHCDHTFGSSKAAWEWAKSRFLRKCEHCLPSKGRAYGGGGGKCRSAPFPSLDPPLASRDSHGIGISYMLGHEFDVCWLPNVWFHL